MQRLSFRTSWPVLAALLLCIGGLNYGLPKAFPLACLDVPLLPVLIIVVGISLSAALLFYDEASPVQAIKLSLLILAIAAGLATLFHLINPAVFSEIRQRPGSHAPVLSINWIFLLTVNLSAIAVVKTLIALNAPSQSGRKRQSNAQSDR